jgi:eukaryotic-like serine/threonine-protein kinase
MAIQSGTHLGYYEILAPLGAGGMGEVYRARDGKLGRDVALKVLPEAFARDAERMARFQREAKVLASLNHPNIATIHGLEDSGATHALVMELVEGPTLADRIQQGPIPIDEALRIAKQICEALEYAHERGIVHRDLKPANIKVTNDDAVKVLDFGLAKAIEGDPSSIDISSSPTMSRMATMQGILLGTAAYMSPEQAKGKSVDRRADIWAFGCVLYEMLTGKMAFSGETVTDTLAAVIMKEVDLSSLAAATPLRVRVLLQRCLQKEPKQRLRDIGDARISIDETLSGLPDAMLLGAPGAATTATPQPAVPQWRRALPWGLSALLAVVLIAGAIVWRSEKSVEGPAYFLAVLPFPAVDVSVAPDERTVAVVGFSESDRTNVLWLYAIGDQQARKLPDTNGARFPFWSPDGKSLAFFAEGKLKRLDIAGGPVQTICDAASGRGGTWNKDGVIVFTPTGGLLDGLYRVPASGGIATRISTPDPTRGESTNRWPEFLPDGKHFLYFGGDVSGSIAESAASNAIFVGALGSNQKTFVTKGTGNASYVAPGYLLYYRDKTLFAQPFDADELKVSGDPVALLTDVAYTPRISHTAFSAAEGVLVAQRGSGVSVSQLVWYDRKGNAVGSVGERENVVNVTLAPDGKTLALDRTDEATQNSDVWTYDLQRNSLNRLTFDPSVDAAPVFSPDGKQILFASSRDHLFKVYLKNTDGTQQEKLLPVNGPDRYDRYPSDWSRDGRYILYTYGTDLWVAESPDWRTRPFVQGHGAVKNAQFSPDERWVAYASSESGRWEVYVTSFPDARGKWQVSTAGGTQPRWRGDSKELFYLAADGKIMSVSVAGGPTFDAGTSVALFQANPRVLVATSDRVSYDVSKDGQRFLINTQQRNSDAQPMTVVLDWQALPKK